VKIQPEKRLAATSELHLARDIKPVNSKMLQMTRWKSYPLMDPKKQDNACGEIGLAGKPFGQGYLFFAQRQVKKVHKTRPKTYLENDRVVLRNRRIRENLEFYSVIGLRRASEGGGELCALLGPNKNLV
jgi:hypothetical protein